jgi:hypothetical protein
VSAQGCRQRAYCRRSGAFDRHAHARTLTHSTQKDARASARTNTPASARGAPWILVAIGLSDAFERSHLRSDSFSSAYLFLAKRRAHLTGFDLSLYQSKARVHRELAYLALASLCSFALRALIAFSSFACT